MNKYNVTVEGSNFLINIEKIDQKYGFFTTRFINAENSLSAEKKALDYIRNELKDIVLNEQSDPPMMFLDKIEKAETFGDQKTPGSGFTWFKDED